jgi:galactokinase
MTAPSEALAREATIAFRVDYGGDPQLVVRAPGRVSVLGGHVDYNEGWVMPAAIDRSIVLAVRSRSDKVLNVRSAALGESAAVSLNPLPGPGSAPTRTPWMAYPLGVAWALRGMGVEIGGLDATLLSDLPRDAGVSSSAALETAFLLAWTTLAGADLDRFQLAILGQRVENEYLGVGSGVQDQFASLHGRLDHVLVLDCRSHEWEAISLPAGIVALVADSGVRRRLLDGGLNDRREECEVAVRQLRENGLPIAALRDIAPEDLSLVDSTLAPHLARRARHVVEECARVRLGAALLKSESLDELGELMAASHRSSRDLYEVSLPELDILAEAAQSADGCVGARLSGAGFGGCVVALCEADAVMEVGKRVDLAFSEKFGRSPELFHCRLAEAAGVLP